MHSIREPVAADAYPVARAHVRSWQVAYRGLFPDDYLDALTPEDRLEQWERRIADRSITPYFLVADVDGTAIGLCTASTSDEGAAQIEVRTLYVDPDHWGQGAGRALHDAILDRIRADGFTELQLWVAPSNRRARTFYERCGWRDDAFEKTETWIGGLTVTSRRYVRSLEPMR